MAGWTRPWCRRRSTTRWHVWACGRRRRSARTAGSRWRSTAPGTSSRRTRCRPTCRTTCSSRGVARAARGCEHDHLVRLLDARPRLTPGRIGLLVEHVEGLSLGADPSRARATLADGEAATRRDPRRGRARRPARRRPRTRRGRRRDGPRAARRPTGPARAARGRRRRRPGTRAPRTSLSSRGRRDRAGSPTTRCTSWRSGLVLRTTRWLDPPSRPTVGGCGRAWPRCASGRPSPRPMRACPTPGSARLVGAPDERASRPVRPPPAVARPGRPVPHPSWSRWPASPGARVGVRWGGGCCRRPRAPQDAAPSGLATRSPRRSRLSRLPRGRGRRCGPRPPRGRRGGRRARARRRRRADRRGRPGPHARARRRRCWTPGSSRTMAAAGRPRTSRRDGGDVDQRPARGRRARWCWGCAGPTTGGASGTSPRARGLRSVPSRQARSASRRRAESQPAGRDRRAAVAEGQDASGRKPSASRTRGTARFRTPAPPTRSRRARCRSANAGTGTTAGRCSAFASAPTTSALRSAAVTRLTGSLDLRGEQVLDGPDLVGERDPRPELPTVPEPPAHASKSLIQREAAAASDALLPVRAEPARLPSAGGPPRTPASCAGARRGFPLTHDRREEGGAERLVLVEHVVAAREP